MIRLLYPLVFFAITACSNFNPFGLTAEEERRIAAMSPAEKQQLLAAIMAEQADINQQNALAAQQRAYRQAELEYAYQQADLESQRRPASLYNRNSGRSSNYNVPAVQSPRTVSVNTIGGASFRSDGISVQKIGDTYFQSDGLSYRQSGDQIYYSDGTTARKVGDTYYFSNGGSVRKVGTTLYYSD